MIPRPGRPTPAFGVAAATRHGIDLSQHRSAWLSRSVAEAASLLVVFDDVNRASVLNRYPDLRVPVVRLGDLLDGSEIADPVDGGPEVFQACYARIAAGVEELARRLQPAAVVSAAG